MSPPRFYCPQLANSPKVPGAQYALEPAEARHATSVLRLKVDDCLSLFDGCGRTALARVVEAKRESVRVEVEQWFEPPAPSRTELILAIALPKGDRQKTLVDAATELGASRLIPILCRRGVAQPTDSALERLRRQVIEACKQCGRNHLMEISEPVELAKLSSSLSASNCLRLLAHPYDVCGPRRHIRWHLQGPPSSCCLAIGPEGGFTDEEANTLVQEAWSAVELWPLILRIEIAAITAMAQVAGWYHEAEVS